MSTGAWAALAVALISAILAAMVASNLESSREVNLLRSNFAQENLRMGRELNELRHAFKHHRRIEHCLRDPDLRYCRESISTDERGPR